jgi:hypothetical protein
VKKELSYRVLEAIKEHPETRYLPIYSQVCAVVVQWSFLLISEINQAEQDSLETCW